MIYWSVYNVPSMSAAVGVMEVTKAKKMSQRKNTKCPEQMHLDLKLLIFYLTMISLNYAVV